MLIDVFEAKTWVHGTGLWARMWLASFPDSRAPAQESGNEARLWLVILTMYVPSCFGLTFVVWLARTRKIACSFACCWFSWFEKWSSSGPLCFYLVASIWNQFWTAGRLDSLFLAGDVVDSQLPSSSAFPSTWITTLHFSLGVWWDTLLV